MAVGTTRKISAETARSHTRKLNSKTSSSSGMFMRILFVSFTGLMAWAYQAAKPPPPMTCGSTDGPPITAPRIQLKDGRYLAYKESGVSKDIAKHKILFVHGFDSCRHDVVSITATLSQDLVESQGIYIVSFDRPGYGESDPHPTRTPKSLALDIEELADQLGLGSKFYVVGHSLGGQIVWTCLKYIPHRLAGAALLAPATNYWWSGIPSNISQEAFAQLPLNDQWAWRVVHHMPWLCYWWNNQKIFPGLSVMNGNPNVLSRQDMELMPWIVPIRNEYLAQIRQQGEFESVHRDVMIGFGTWEFSPTDLKNPSFGSEVRVHLWQGDEDKLVPVTMQRYIACQLPWIQYHELSGAGHMFPFAEGIADSIIQSLVVDKKNLS